MLIQNGRSNFGVSHFGAADPGFPPARIPATDAGLRTATVRVAFPAAYSSPPVVAVALASLDTWHPGAFEGGTATDNSTGRLAVLPAANITADGFDLTVATWWDSGVYGVGVEWTAFGEV